MRELSGLPHGRNVHEVGPRTDLNVLVVDDSAVVRRILSSVLSQDGSIVVTTASDPLIAMRKMKQCRPDVIVLDIEMPRMDGITFLRKIMAEAPVPVVICSGHAGLGTKTVLEALRHGAVDIITKPQYAVRDFLQESAILLIDTVKAAAQANVLRRGSSECAPMADPAKRDVAVAPLHSIRRPGQRVLAIGASTGGPEAIETVLRDFPPDAPGTVIVQHMPAPFTEAFAKRLNDCSQVEVQEASDGSPIEQGRVLIAPGDRHLTVVNNGSGYCAKLDSGPLVSRHRPSIDVLLCSVAETVGPGAVGVVMTGMGDDGVEGLLKMKRAGATTIAQDEKTSVVFGMPKVAIARGATDYVLPVTMISSFLLGASSSPYRSGRLG